MTSDKEVLKAVKTVVALLENKGKIKKEIDGLIIQREDIDIDLGRRKKKAERELADFKESLIIERNTLTTQLDCLKGELKRLPGEIASKKESIINFDLTIDGLKQQNAELEGSNKKLTEINDGLRSDAKKRSKQLAEV